ncbi:MAG: DegV family EDD domain-containing protein [Candidatus Heimdallarchaeota archaeon]|nr:DegV family EDD domain-containing protein [Candidatus Heimdallarchaeota archaeon]
MKIFIVYNLYKLKGNFGDIILTIVIVTDSASDILWDFAAEKGVKIVPISVSYYGKTYQENSDYDFDKHFKLYETDDNFLPKTTQPSPKEFLEAYEKAIGEGARHIITVCISSALSGTINSANVAKKMIESKYEKVEVHIIDSKNASYAEGFLVEEILESIKKGLGIDRILENLKVLVKRVKSFILLPTLKYLHLGGRISTPKYLLARLLRKKVITKTNEKGELKPAGTFSKLEEGLEEMIKLTMEGEERMPRKVAIVYANDLSLRDKLQALVAEKIPNAVQRIVRTRASISAHVGPRAIALISDFGFED